MNMLFGLLGLWVLAYGFALVIVGSGAEQPPWQYWLGSAILSTFLVVRAENLVRAIRRILGLATLGLAIVVLPPAYTEPTLHNGLVAGGLVGGWGVLHLLLCRLEAYVTGRYVRIFPWLPGLQ